MPEPRALPIVEDSRRHRRTEMAGLPLSQPPREELQEAQRQSSPRVRDGPLSLQEGAAGVRPRRVLSLWQQVLPEHADPAARSQGVCASESLLDCMWLLE